MCPILNYKAWLIVLTVVFERDIAKVMMTTKKTIELEQCAILQTPKKTQLLILSADGWNRHRMKDTEGDINLYLYSFLHSLA